MCQSDTFTRSIKRLNIVNIFYYLSGFVCIGQYGYYVIEFVMLKGHFEAKDLTHFSHYIPEISLKYSNVANYCNLQQVNKLIF